MKTVTTAEEAEAIRETVEALADGRYAIDDAGHVEWHDFLYKVEEEADIDLGTSMDSPAIKAIKRMVREALQE